MEIFRISVLICYTVCSVLLLLYGLNTYFIIYLFLRKRRSNEEADRAVEGRFSAQFEKKDSLPVVTTQIPLYNEVNVAERVITAVANIDYPTRWL